MNNERKQDLSGPDEEALEQHVREMLDVNAEEPEAKPTVAAPASKLKAKKGVSINVVDHTDEPTNVAPKAEPKSTELIAAIEATNEQLAAQAGTAPLVAKPAPAKAKKVAITHFDDDETSVDIKDTESLAEDEPVAETVAPDNAKESPADIEPLLEEEAVEPAEIQEAQDNPEVLENQDASPLEQVIDAPETDQAVNDIISKESDDLLAVQDVKLTEPAQKQSKPKRSLISRWAHSSGARWTTFLLIFAGLASAGVMPQSRYYLLNKAGVRSSASVVITDQSTLRPLKNVTVSIAGQSVQTDAEGKAQLGNLLLGPTELVVDKRAFASTRKSVTIGWGSNPLDAVALSPKGDQYSFIITDYLSDKPIANAEITAGEASATSDEKGEIKLTLADQAEDKVKLTITAAGYRTETSTLELSNKQKQAVKLVPVHKVAFVSKRSGAYDLYTIDADGKNEIKVLAGSGSETNDITLAPHPTAEAAALVSTREIKRAADGALLTTLTYVNLKDKTTKTVTQSTQIRLVDWIGTRLIYVQLNVDAKSDDPGRYRLMSYDYVSGDNRQLASTNYFNDIVSAGGEVYYAPASAYQNGVNLGVFMVHADGSGKKPILNQEAWNVLRTDYNKLTLAVQQDWYDYTLGSEAPTKLAGQPGNTAARLYVDSPDAKHSVWLDSRDGKGTIVLYDTSTKTESTVYALNGVKGPIRWINNSTVVFRQSTSKETADYIVNINGGSPKKLVDVTSTAGIDRWSY
jgi:Tol biopolymer transport system component